MSELRGIRALVTGSTSGLGAAMAAALAEAGAPVMVTGRNQSRAEATATDLGASALPCQLDVRDGEPCDDTNGTVQPIGTLYASIWASGMFDTVTQVTPDSASPARSVTLFAHCALRTADVPEVTVAAIS